MPVYLGDSSVLAEFNYEKIESDQVLKENAKAFIDNVQKECPPVRLLYVGQREYATVKSDDPYIDILGSDSATTCHIVLIIDRSTKNSSLCHFDGSDMKNGIDSMLRSLKILRPDIQVNVFDLYIVGGFKDPKKYSIKTTQTLMSYNLKTSKVFMCNHFVDKGPDNGVRGARHFSEENNLSIYDSVRFKLVIGPFSYDPLEYVGNYLQLPDEILLKYFSTSPEQEPHDFIDSLKNTFQAMLDHPNPLETYFKRNTPHIYRKEDNGKWIREIS